MGAALLAVLGATSLAAGGPASATPSGTTVVTVKVKGCEGCTIQAFAALQEEMGAMPYVDWRSRRLTVNNGAVTFEIPTAYTNGMSLQVTAPWERGSVNAVPMATLSKNSWCWPGTTKSKVTLRLIVKKLTTDGFPTGTAVIPNAYLASLPEPRFPGGHQDLPYCEVPR